AMTGGPVTNGTMGALAVYPNLVEPSIWRTSQLTGFNVLYWVNHGPSVSLGIYNLSVGWNMFTFTVNGVVRTIFIQGLSSNGKSKDPPLEAGWCGGFILSARIGLTLILRSFPYCVPAASPVNHKFQGNGSRRPGLVYFPGPGQVKFRET